MGEKFRFYVQHSLNDLRANRERTLFALLCIAAGVAAIVSLQTLGEMINATLTGSLQEANKADLHIFSGPEEGAPDETQRQGRAEGILQPGGPYYPDFFGESGLAHLRDWFESHFPGQTTITYQQTFSDLTTGAAVSLPARETEKTFVSVYIVDAALYPLYGERRSVDGTPLRDLLREPRAIVISDNLAEDLGAAIGDTLRVSGASVDFTLRGIVATDAEGGVDNLFAGFFGFYYLDHAATQYFSAAPAAYDVFVRLDDPGLVDAVDAAFKADFPYLTTITTADLKERNSQAAGIITDLVTVMGLVSLLIGGIGIINTMLVIVSRRSTEIAILKTIGLEPGAISALFLMEAILMGLIGSMGGVLLGWVLALAVKGVAERFVAQSLVFRLAPEPALTGLVVGFLIAAIFGMLPTLAAGRVRPSLVLRPSDDLVPRAGRRQSLVALIGMLAALSLVTQGLVGDLLDSGGLRALAGNTGAILGVLLGLGVVAGGSWRWLRRGIAVVVAGALGYVFGMVVPALLLITAAGLVMALLYVALWVLIWAVGGGALADWPLPRRLRWGCLILLAIPLLPLWLVWGIGSLIQRAGFIDLKLALRSLRANRGRGASTLLALVIGVFTLSLITMLVDSITQAFENLLEREAGGNVFVLSSGGEDARAQITHALDTLEGVHSYALVERYEARLVAVEDYPSGEVIPYDTLQERVTAQNPDFDSLLANSFSSIDARELGSNLPDVPLYEGIHLTPVVADQPVIVIEANDATLAAGLHVSDKLTFGFESGAGEQWVTFTIMGMTDRRGGSLQVGGASSYAPVGVFPPGVTPTQINTVVDITEEQIPALRRLVSDIPGTFVLETRFLNDVVNSLIDQFTAFPILVAALALFTGGVVIANSVALSTLERRREIAVMKAVGLQRERVLGMLLLENAVMGLTGGLIGVGIGVAILAVLLAGFFGGTLGDMIPYGTAFALMGVCVGVALVAAVLPVWGASGEKPLNVLRYE